MEAINHAGTCLGIITTDGIILAAEKKVTTKLLDQQSEYEKIFKISNDLIVAVAGITSDANSVIDYARTVYEKYRFTYNEPMPVEQLVQTVCNLKQSYTQHGGMRPYGVSFIYAGWDKVYGWQLYQSDPSGNYSGWKATCIGTNSTTAASIFKTDAKSDQMSQEEAFKLLTKVLHKTLEAATVDAEKVEMAVLKRTDDELVMQNVEKSFINTLVTNYAAEMNAAASSS